MKQPELAWARGLLGTALIIVLVFCALPARADGLLGYQAPEQTVKSNAVLYYRFLDTPWLGQESRTLEVSMTESAAKARVQALLDGPRNLGRPYTSLFPPGTQVLSVLEEGDLLFVTFSKEFLNPLPGEEGYAQMPREAAVTRRRLAMASLANTLTEGGEYRSVQVLVLQDPGISTSMRLSQRYYLEDSDAIPDPLPRQEDAILTPGRAARTILTYWSKQDWTNLARSVAGAPPGTAELPAAAGSLQALPLLMEVECTEGVVSPDGASAVVVVDAVFKPMDRDEVPVNDYPLVMYRHGHGWLLSLQSLLALAEGAE